MSRHHHRDRDDDGYGQRRSRRVETRLTEALIPYGLGIVALAVSGTGHIVWVEQAHDFRAVLFGLAVILGGGGWLTMLTRDYARPRGPVILRHATQTAVAYVTAALITFVWGLRQPWFPHAALTLVGLLGLSWNIRTIGAIRGEGRDRHGDGDDGGPLGELAKQIKLGKVTTDGPRITAKIRLRDGTTAKQMDGIAGKLGSLFGLPIGSPRFTPDPSDQGAGTLTLLTQDMLAESVPWPGPTSPGANIIEPIHMGVFDDGEPIVLIIPGDPDRGITPLQLLTAGMTGAGKTIWALLIAVNILCRRQVATVWVDTVKGEQSVYPIRDGLAKYIGPREGNNHARAFLRRLVSHVVPYRAQLLGRQRLDQWTPAAVDEDGQPLPLLIVMIEEAAPLIADVGDTLTRAVEQLRSVGIILIMSMQRPSAGNLPTDARAQFGYGACFGVESEVDAGMVLSSQTIAAGAQPELWKNNRPGAVYVELPGTPPERWSTPGRTYTDPVGVPLKQAIAEQVARWEEARSDIDLGTREAFGPLWEGPAVKKPATQVATTGTPAGVPATAEEGDQAVDDDDEVEDPRLAAMRREQEQPLALPPGMSDVDFTPPPNGTPPRSWTQEQKDGAWNAMLRRVADGGADEVKMAELVETFISIVGWPAANARNYINNRVSAELESGRFERSDRHGYYVLRMQAVDAE